jgi:D-arginine dehydrogenase
MEQFDVVVIGAGMAGASLAWALAPRRRVLVLERESQPGYHSTGRSAATLHSSYGNRTIRALTAASAPFYLDPPPGFAEAPLSRPRAVLKVARADQLAELEQELERTRWFVPQAQRLDAAACLALAPALRPDYVAGGVLDPTMLDLDVAVILAGFLRGARSRGAVVHTSVRIDAVERASGNWQVTTDGGVFGGPILVDAAGAWADQVAGMAGLAPLGIAPHRRTAILVDAPKDADCGSWPMLEAVGEAWYVKPDAGQLLCSPADETPSAPGDAQPEELDVAICVERIEGAFAFPIRRIVSRWAGLRCFAADRTPVAGFDPRTEGFVWLAGQGGYGIQTAPALAALVAAAILGEAPHGPAAGADIDPGNLTPARLLRLAGDAGQSLASG